MKREKVAVWRLLLLSAIGGAGDLGYAVEEGYAVPIIRGVGIPLKYATVALAAGPVVSLFLQTLLGALSDQCSCRWGRRKPFILCLSLMAIVGCGASYMTYLANFSAVLTKLCVIALIALFDFSIGQIQSPTRALLLDVVPVSQAQTGNFIFSLVLIVYTTLGFCFGAIDWSGVFGEGFRIENQAQVVFGLAAVVIFVSMMLTLFSVKEVIPNVHCNTKNESASISVVDSEQIALLDKNDEGIFKSNDDHKSVNTEKNLKQPSCVCLPIGEVFIKCFIDVVSFIYHMSFAMWILWFITLFGFLGEFSFVYGFTTFVGTVIYKGNSEAHLESKEYSLYTEGVRMGSLVLVLSTLVGGILSLSLNYITKWIRLKTVFLFTCAAFVISTLLLILLQEIYFTFIFGLCYGPLLVTLLVIPFAFLPGYEKDNCMFRSAWGNAPDVMLGKACSVMNTALFLGQIGASFLVGPIVEGLEDGNYFMTIPCFAASITLFLAIFIRTPSN